MFRHHSLLVGAIKAASPSPFSTSRQSYHAGKAKGVDAAIKRGLIKSHGIDFRGKAGKQPENDPREIYRKRHNIPPYTPQKIYHRRNGEGYLREPGVLHRQKQHRNAGIETLRKNLDEGQLLSLPNLRPLKSLDHGRRGKEEKKMRDLFGKSEGPRTVGRTRSGRNQTPRDAKGTWENAEEAMDAWSERDFARAREPRGQTSRSSGLSQRQSSDQLRGQEDLFSNSRGANPRPRAVFTNEGRFSPRIGTGYKGFRCQNDDLGHPKQLFREATWQEQAEQGQDEAGETDAIRKYSSSSSPGYKGLRFQPNEAIRPEQSENEAIGRNVIRKYSSGVPLSVPYTTPASEFLYGTSVVEAALSSTKSPRRKLYKLYIYNGENRGTAERDAIIERLARSNGVEVVHAGNDWLRILDKMSGGRPHNGYVLEASPLPKLPVTALGPVSEEGGREGFHVSVDYQSREDAGINGTSDFIPLAKSKNGRKPFVLYLDSILDPGNLGGIIRTAHFLGAAAIAISVRNTASFSPVVLKASAGASENVTLFTVNKPAGFIVNSKNAGWRVFAAVAPSKRNDPAMPLSLSTNELDDPLANHPCILMLGSEGEGLRWNLRSKADVDLYIAGSGFSHNIDSLNVSVATGVLCNAFFNNPRRTETSEPTNPIMQTLKSTGDMF